MTGCSKPFTFFLLSSLLRTQLSIFALIVLFTCRFGPPLTSVSSKIGGLIHVEDVIKLKGEQLLLSLFFACLASSLGAFSLLSSFLVLGLHYFYFSKPRDVLLLPSTLGAHLLGYPKKLSMDDTQALVLGDSFPLKNPQTDNGYQVCPR